MWNCNIGHSCLCVTGTYLSPHRNPLTLTGLWRNVWCLWSSKQIPYIARHITCKQSLAFGLSLGFLRRQMSTKLWKSSLHSPPDNDGWSFCAMWYKALMAFMLNNGGLRSAATIQENAKHQRLLIKQIDKITLKLFHIRLSTTIHTYLK